MFNLCHLQLGSDEVWVSHRSSQHPDSLTVCGDVCSSPHSGRRVRCLCDALEGIAHSGLNPSNIPHVRFPTMNPNVGMPQKFILQDGAHCTNSLWPGENVNVVKVCENPFVGSQSLLCGHKGWVLSNSKEQGHQWVPLLPAFALGDPVHSATIVLPQVRGWTTIEKVDKTEAPPITPSKPANIARLEMRSNALTPSTEVRVNCSSVSHKAWMQWATHSHPDFVDRANWNGDVAAQTAGPNCWAMVRATSLRMTSNFDAPHTSVALAEGRQPANLDDIQLTVAILHEPRDLPL